MIRDHWWHAEARLLNTVSNAAYPTAGALLAWQQGTAAAWAFAVSMLALGVGSGLYHWHGTPNTRSLDWLGTYAVLTVLATVSATQGIEAGFSVRAAWVSTPLRIFAGLCGWRLPIPEECEVRAEVRSGTVAHGTVVAPEVLRGDADAHGAPGPEADNKEGT